MPGYAALQVVIGRRKREGRPPSIRLRPSEEGPFAVHSSLHWDALAVANVIATDQDLESKCGCCCKLRSAEWAVLPDVPPWSTAGRQLFPHERRDPESREKGQSILVRVHGAWRALALLTLLLFMLYLIYHGILYKRRRRVHT